MRSNNSDVVVVDAADCGSDGGGSVQLQPDQCGSGVIRAVAGWGGGGSRINTTTAVGSGGGSRISTTAAVI
jgi:hypothetical protein